MKLRTANKAKTEKKTKVSLLKNFFDFFDLAVNYSSSVRP
jgi:hypothetical protein